MNIDLPLPAKALSPNARAHYHVTAKAKKQAKGLAMLLTSQAMMKEKPPFVFRAYQLHFRWPDNRRRDIDNAVASCKAYLDGVAAKIRQDDSEWAMRAPTIERGAGSGLTITLIR